MSYHHPENGIQAFAIRQDRKLRCRYILENKLVFFRPPNYLARYLSLHEWRNHINMFHISIEIIQLVPQTLLKNDQVTQKSYSTILP